MISISILSKKDDYIDAVNKINNTNSDYLHIDIMDNTYTDNTSFTISDVKNIINNCNKKIDIHLMSKDLSYMIDELIKLKPNIISFHYESTDNIDEYIKIIKDNNIKVGLAINPETSIKEIYNYLDDIDIVLVMSVNPGMGGQPYIESTTNKLIELKQLQNNYNYLIEVDGGINNKTIKEVKDYTDIVVSGSYITSSNDYQSKINELLDK